MQHRKWGFCESVNMKGVNNMEKIINNYLEQAKIGRKQSYKNLALFPLLSTYSLDLDYLLLDEALSEQVIEVVEVGEEETVPEKWSGTSVYPFCNNCPARPGIISVITIWRLR